MNLPATPTVDDTQALMAAMRAILEPVARLAVARGLPYAALEEVLKQAVVAAAGAAHPDIAAHRSVSRIATATGINRREVGRVLDSVREGEHRPARSPAAEVYTHWRGDARYCSADGRPHVLPRLGPEPSFETLAQAVTRDVHPRSLLDELLRLQLATLDEANDTVHIADAGFVPRGDQIRMLGFLADNAGDHLRAGVDNVLGDGRRHFEQALFADGLTAQSMQAVKALIGPQWQALMQALVPPLERLVEADEHSAPAEQRRVRIGLYAYDEPTAQAQAAQATEAPAGPRAPRRRPRKT